uniref:Kinesin light chain n=1 Tax=Amphimedon queenslandica TaxID=400682 RepID=A0A1X7SDM2_AMPQE
YCCGAERNVVALRLLYRVMYLIMLTLGEDHPEMSNVDFNIGLLLSNAGHYEESQAYLESARRLQNK